MVNNGLTICFGTAAESQFITYPIAFRTVGKCVGSPYCNLTWDGSQQFSARWLITNMSNTQFQVHCTDGYGLCYVSFGY